MMANTPYCLSYPAGMNITVTESNMISQYAIRFDGERYIRVWRILLCAIFFFTAFDRRQDPIYVRVTRFRVRASDY